MKWTGLSAIACAAMLTIACAGDTRDRDDDRNDSAVLDESGNANDRAGLDSDVDDQARLNPGGDDRSMVGTSGQTQGTARQTQGASGSTHGADGDARHFVETAAMTSHAEVELGKLASERAQSQEVKQFAQMMIRDHTKSGNELQQAVKPHNVHTTAEMDQKHQQLLTRLRGLRGAEFDREYMKAMVDGHREVKSMLEKRAGEGRTAANNRNNTSATAGNRTTGTAGTAGMAGSNTALETTVNQWATKTLPAVEQHLQKAEQIHASLQNDSRNTRGTGTTGNSTPNRNATPNSGTSRPAN